MLWREEKERIKTAIFVAVGAWRAFRTPTGGAGRPSKGQKKNSWREAGGQSDMIMPDRWAGHLIDGSQSEPIELVQ